MGFDQFIGNSSAVSAVREMLAGGRVRGSLLFAGPDGVGKKTLALMMAKALVCERQGPSDFCGECPRCRKAEEMLALGQEDLARRREMKDSTRRVEGLIYFDLQIIEPLTRFILSEQIRQLRSIVYTRPFEFPLRIFIVDEAQTIHWQAVDLLLKVLEEPPDTTLLVLVCPNAYELRPTIRSRCRRVPFQPVEEAVIAELLAKDQRLTRTQQILAARVAAGSVARARSFDLAEYETRRKPWLTYLEAVSQHARAKATPDLRGLFESARALTQERGAFEETLKVGYCLLRDLLHVLLESSDDAVINLDIVPRLKVWAAGLGLAGIEQIKSGFDQAYRLQVRNVNQQLGLETLGIDLLSSPDRARR